MELLACSMSIRNSGSECEGLVLNPTRKRRELVFFNKFSSFLYSISELCASAIASTSSEALALRAASQAKPWFPPLGFLREKFISYSLGKRISIAVSKSL
jgi:hypothetical protein